MHGHSDHPEKSDPSAPLMGILNSVSVKYSGPALLLLPVLFVVLAFAVLTQWHGRRMAQNLAGQIVDQAAHRIEAVINHYLQHAVFVTDQVAEQIAAGELDPSALRDWRPALYRQLRIDGEVNSVTYGNPRGDATWMIRYPGEEGLEYAISDAKTNGKIVEHRVGPRGELAEELDAYDYDPRVRPWYVAAVESNRPTWSPPYAWVRGDGRQATLGIAFARPIVGADGELVGVLDSDISLKDVSRFLNDARVFDSGEAFLVDRDGQLIGTSSTSPVIDEDGSRVMATSSPSELIREVAEGITADLRPQRTQLSVDGEPFVVDVRPLRNPWDLPWTLAVVVPDSEIMAGVNSLQTQGWIVGGVVSWLTLCLGVFAAWSIVGPVTQLAAAVKTMGKGNLDDPVRVGGHLEFVQLSDELNQMCAALKDRMRLRNSLALAMEIQQKLLPQDEPSVNGLEIAGHSTYCDETGGDYYDFLELSPTSPDELVVAVGDVMGHGIAAALVMATARGILRSHAREDDSLGEWLTAVNDLLVEDTAGERFMTMVLLFIDAQKRRVRMASAGHDSPIIFDPRTESFLEMEDVSGVPLGLFEEQEFAEANQEDLPPGTIILVGTDGLWESHNEADEQYGKERLFSIIRTHADRPVKEISQAIRDDLYQFRGDAKQADDITLVMVKLVDRS
ncbi:Phosphoserine phosphatase RsbU [Planctomycetes bacterium Pan216]|uniref:Phosphoserine phosphatase RsbU n=1 Tax=Kolteria novifilia TaxID=2527975 RepID=A0A518B797_9BACT|nr:Phosphoserine phosphatase RsbU [Planctomycetes bacterium Pan216]